MGVFTFLGEASKAFHGFFNFYTPVGPLSGVSTSAIVVWLAAWYLLARRWRGTDVNVGKASTIAFALLAVAPTLHPDDRRPLRDERQPPDDRCQRSGRAGRTLTSGGFQPSSGSR
jgi:hypothetical protein